MNEHIIKLNKHILNAWESLEKAAKNKDGVTIQSFLDKINHFENLKEQQIALEQSIVASMSEEKSAQIAVSPVNHNNSNHTLSTEPLGYTNRLKRKTTKPKEVRIGSFRKPVFFSNEILITVANWLIEQGKTLPSIPNFIHPIDSGFAQSAVPRRLNNGTFIEVGDNQETLLKKARRLLNACGYRNLKLEILFEDGNLKTC